jgi:hypothetical protein
MSRWEVIGRDSGIQASRERMKGERVGSLKTGADTYIDAGFNCKKP